jgi:hypothetical protein
MYVVSTNVKRTVSELVLQITRGMYFPPNLKQMENEFEFVLKNDVEKQLFEDQEACHLLVAKDFYS